MTTPAPDHILIVDDDAGIRELAAEYLQRQGLQVSVSQYNLRASLANARNRLCDARATATVQ